MKSKTRTPKAIIREITRLIKAGGMARMDLTADEYGTIQNAPELRGLARQVTAAPGEKGKGVTGLDRAQVARLCCIKPPCAMPEPVHLEWHANEGDATKAAAKLQAQRPGAIVRFAHYFPPPRGGGRYLVKPDGTKTQIHSMPAPFTPWRPIHPEARPGWAVHVWEVGDFMARHFPAYHPGEVVGMFEAMLNRVEAQDHGRRHAARSARQTKADQNQQAIRAAFDAYRENKWTQAAIIRQLILDHGWKERTIKRALAAVPVH